MATNIDEELRNADWPKRTDDSFELNLRSASRKETKLHAVADSFHDKLRNALNYAFAQGRKAVNKSMLSSASSADHAFAKVPDAVHSALLDILPSVLEDIVLAGGTVTLETKREVLRTAAQEDFVIKKKVDVPKGQKLRPLKFDTSYAVDWINEHAVELAKNLSETTRQDIADALVRAFEKHNKGEAWSRLEKDILAAVGDEDRADAIAETEKMTAANAGQRAAWAQQVDTGFLFGDEKRVWVTFGGACPECEELEGEAADLDGLYPGDVTGPPLHTRCRCIEELRK